MNCKCKDDGSGCNSKVNMKAELMVRHNDLIWVLRDILVDIEHELTTLPLTLIARYIADKLVDETEEGGRLK
jgi:hypothetical protein